MNKTKQKCNNIFIFLIFFLNRRDHGRSGAWSADHEKRRVLSLPFRAWVCIWWHRLSSLYSCICHNPVWGPAPGFSWLWTSGRISLDECSMWSDAECSRMWCFWTQVMINFTDTMFSLCTGGTELFSFAQIPWCRQHLTQLWQSLLQTEPLSQC